MIELESKIIPAKIYNSKFWLSNCDISFLSEKLNISLEESEFKILNKSDYIFDNEGYTCMWLLAESHLAVHSFPNENKSYIELSSCNRDKLEKFNIIMKTNYPELLLTKTIDINVY
ncbi:MAG: S-adenosylmethionine decarboxylase [Marinifilaceae bacterium]|jgi:S-adenosylmethionine decarboxylase|nr:S-adenosylmethionine decarboxylase [Marinifilaceae bacterium]